MKKINIFNNAIYLILIFTIVSIALPVFTFASSNHDRFPSSNNDVITDTIMDVFVYQYPVNSISSYESYGEGFFKEIKCKNDNYILMINFGSAIVYLNKDRCITGSYENEIYQSERRYELHGGQKVYFRKLEFKGEKFAIYYFGIDSLLLDKYDNILENSKIIIKSDSGKNIN